jgi:hypothetical protein
MNIKALFFLFMPALLANGCVSEYTADLPSNDMQILVVDGSIIENVDATFHISKSFSLNSYNIPNDCFIDNANLAIIGSNGYKSSPAINQGKGAYRISVGKLDDDVEYGIQIEYDGDTYQSTLSKPLYTSEIDSVSWTQPEKFGAVFFRISTHDDKPEPKFFTWSYTEIWEITAANYTTVFFDPQNDVFYYDSQAPYYYCWKKNESDRFLLGSTATLRENKIINKQLYQSDPEDSRFSVLYSVTVNQKAISQGAYEYYQNIIKLNEEMGGLFTPQPSDLGGNIACITDPSKRIMGYVETVKNTTQKRIFVNQRQITRFGFYNDCYNTIANDSVLAYLAEKKLTFADYYRMGYQPAGGMDVRYYPEIVPTEWALDRCTDCRANGGSKNKPDFWPNPHE